MSAPIQPSGVCNWRDGGLCQRFRTYIGNKVSFRLDEIPRCWDTALFLRWLVSRNRKKKNTADGYANIKGHQLPLCFGSSNPSEALVSFLLNSRLHQLDTLVHTFYSHHDFLYCNEHSLCLDLALSSLLCRLRLSTRSCYSSHH